MAKLSTSTPGVPRVRIGAFTNKISKKISAKAQKSRMTTMNNIIQSNLRLSRAEAKAETYQTIAMTMSQRMRDVESKYERSSKDVLEIYERISEVMPPSADMDAALELLEKLLAESTSPEQILSGMMQVYENPDVIALIMQIFMQRKKKKKKILSGILDTLMDELDGSTSVVFASLEFGLKNAEVRQKINSLYQESANSFEGIVALYQKLRKRFSNNETRKRSVLCLILSFAEDLNDNSNALFQIKANYIMQELKRLYTILTMDDHCINVAKAMNKIGDISLNYEDVMGVLIEWLDTEWIYEELLSDNFETLGIEMDEYKLQYSNKMLKVINSLPIVCFEDDTSRKHMVDTLQQYIYKIMSEERKGKNYVNLKF